MVSVKYSLSSAGRWGKYSFRGFFLIVFISQDRIKKRNSTPTSCFWSMKNMNEPCELWIEKWKYEKEYEKYESGDEYEVRDV